MNGLFDSVENMIPLDTQSLDALEQKISLVLERLSTLQAENKELQREVASWKGKYEEAAQQLDTLTREQDDLRRNQRDPGQEELIRSKIAALLAKLEAA